MSSTDPTPVCDVFNEHFLINHTRGSTVLKAMSRKIFNNPSSLEPAVLRRKYRSNIMYTFFLQTKLNPDSVKSVFKFHLFLNYT